MCVANKTINSKQCTICWRVDNLKMSHVDQEVLESIVKQLEAKHSPMTITRGTTHTYVVMNIVYNNDKTVTIDMIQYVKEILEDFLESITKATSNTPVASYLFEVDDECEKLSPEMAKVFHKTVAKLLFLGKQGRPDVQLPIVSYR
jgi:hypothetical protein